MRRETTEGKPRRTFPVRLGQDERRELEAAAAGVGIPLGTFIRRTALDSARADLDEEPEPEPHPAEAAR